MGERGTRSDLNNCAALAELYHVTLDDLVRHDRAKTGVGVPPKGKHMFGLVTVGERGQIVIPKRAREIFASGRGISLMLLEMREGRTGAWPWWTPRCSWPMWRRWSAPSGGRAARKREADLAG